MVKAIADGSIATLETDWDKRPLNTRRRHGNARHYPRGVTDIDRMEVDRPMDDDLAQAVELGEALVEGGDYISGFADRLVIWAHQNGRGMGTLMRAVIDELEAGHAPPEAARIVYERNPIAPNGGLMRCAPVALARHRQPDLLAKDSASTCVVTHYALTCQWSGIIINGVIATLLGGCGTGPASHVCGRQSRRRSRHARSRVPRWYPRGDSGRD